MTQTTVTAVDRYMETFDRCARDHGAVEELLALFAPDATVQLVDDQEPATGVRALREVYRFAVGSLADSKHVWTTSVLDDGRIEARWVSASRTIDGRMVALSGIEHITLDADGLITSVHNRMVTPDSHF